MAGVMHHLHQPGQLAGGISSLPRRPLHLRNRLHHSASSQYGQRRQTWQPGTCTASCRHHAQTQDDCSRATALGKPLLEQLSGGLWACTLSVLVALAPLAPPPVLADTAQEAAAAPTFGLLALADALQPAPTAQVAAAAPALQSTESEASVSAQPAMPLLQPPPPEGGPQQQAPADVLPPQQLPPSPASQPEATVQAPPAGDSSTAAADAPPPSTAAPQSAPEAQAPAAETPQQPDSTPAPPLPAELPAVPEADQPALPPPPATPSINLPPLPTEFPPLPEIKLPRIEEVTLANGLRVFLVEDHEVPLVRGSLLMRGGQRASPPDKVGLATISAAVQRAGGSEAHPGPLLDEALEQRAAYLEASAGGDYLAMGWECLREDVGEVVRLFGEVLRAPALPQDKLDLLRAQVLNLIEHRDDDAGAIPRRKLAQLIYGHDSEFARQPSAAGVRSISRQDVADYLARWQRPDTAVFGVAGDFDAQKMKQLIEEVLGPWAPAEGQPPQPPELPNPPLPEQVHAGTIFLVDQPEMTQAAVALGEPGVSMTDPDAFALDVLNDLLNSFGGRLFNEVRSREGLAYSVSGGWGSMPVDHAGLFAAGGSTAAPGAFLKAVERVLQEATEVAPSEADLAAAKATTLNSFVFNFASTPAQLQRVLVYALLGIPQDYLFQYQAGIQAVTAEDVLAAAQRHLHPKAQTIVVAANTKAVLKELKKAGRPVVPLAADAEADFDEEPEPAPAAVAAAGEPL